MKKGVAIIGTGLQFSRRAPVIHSHKETALKVVVGSTAESAAEAAKPYGCDAGTDWQQAVVRKDVDLVVVCTPPHLHEAMTLAALKAGKPVLCEKPLSRTLQEAQTMAAAAKDSGQVLKCGFNHRHHPAVDEAHRRVAAGEIGDPIFARCRYGICGRPGYENEWRADPAMAAGGHFVEQGVHAIDLFRWFLGDLDEVCGMTARAYFTGQPMEDNGMAIFRSTRGALASLHASLTEWKNGFSFEIFGKDGYLRAEGLGASYGTEKLIAGKRDFSAPFADHVTEFRGRDISWSAEWEEFLAAIREKRDPLGSGLDGLEALRLAFAVYESDKTKRFMKVDRS